MSNDQRDPRVDPVAGDVVETRHGGRYEVRRVDGGLVWYTEVDGDDDGREDAVKLVDWRYYAANDTIIARGGAR